MSKIAVTGASGMLGSVLVPYLLSCGHDVHATDITEIDVRDRTDVVAGIADIRPDIVAHLAAITSLEECEDDPDNAWLTNALGTKYVAQECGRRGIPMAYISSAGIFDGKKVGPYDEFDEPNPINVYGRSKWEGEKYVRQFCPQSWTLRCGWMMSGGPHHDHKFVSHVLAQIEAGVDTIHAVCDKSGSPTYSPDFARLFETLITSTDYGTYHTVSGGSCTRYEMARAILDILGRDDIALRRAVSTFFATTFHAPRPASEKMRNYVLELQGRNNTMRPWREALEEYLADWK